MKHICEYLFTDEFSKERKIVGSVIGAALLVKAALSIRAANKKKQRKALLDNLEPGIVHLFGMARCKYGPTLSIPCLNAELFLRLAKIPYEFHVTGDYELSPTGRIPFMVYNGEVVTDSAFIIEFLLEKQIGQNLNADLTPEQHAVGIAVRRMMTENFRFGLYRMAFVDHHTSLTPLFAEVMGIPLLVAKFGLRQVRKNTIGMLNNVGHGDWTDAEYRAEFVRDIRAVATLVGSKKYLFGDKVSAYDCIVVASLAAFKGVMQLENNEMLIIRKDPILCAYVDRVIQAAFPDLTDLTSPLGTARQSQKFSTF